MILVEHATVVTVDDRRRVFVDGSVLVDGSRILQVGPSREVRPPRVPDRVIDGSRLVVTPGFVDTHVHLSEHLNRGLLLDDIPVDRYLPDWLIPLYSVMTAEDEQHAALLAGIEMIRTSTRIVATDPMPIATRLSGTDAGRLTPTRGCRIP